MLTLQLKDAEIIKDRHIAEAANELIMKDKHVRELIDENSDLKRQKGEMGNKCERIESQLTELSCREKEARVLLE